MTTLGNPRVAVLAAAALLSPAVLLGSPAQAAPPAAPAAAPSGVTTPVGSWQATVSRPDASYEVELFFHPNSAACLVSPAGRSQGTWKRTGAGTFNFKITERWYDDNGTSTGWVDINQNAEQYAARFTSSGISTVYRPDGTVETTVKVDISARRTSGDSPANCS